MRVGRFEDIKAWQKAKELTTSVYKIFNNSKNYKFRDQIQAASVSIMNNIAEGFERSGDKEFGRFLYISKGSCGEVRSMLYLALEFKYISEEEFEVLHNQCVEISKMLYGFIRAL